MPTSARMPSATSGASVPTPGDGGRNSADAPVAGRSGARLSPDDRRRQLVGIGLRKFVERPVQELSLDEVAAEAGVSRGLLFHYFPSKTAYHRAVVEAAGRRVMRNVRPDDGLAGEAALTQMVERFVEQVDRRREFYLALVYGQLPGSGPDESGQGAAVATLRSAFTDLAIERGGFRLAQRPLVHGWVAYVEDRALQSPVEKSPRQRRALVDQCVSALTRLLTS
ncbi:MAG TPA: TetR/AcrR family transcriptional regulator [Phycicoccus sp.]|nr:TetR/AcrR family transcriptional regulator [Phycicoccus sp.]